jgi:polyhydroxybutyrate depolymerase
MLSNNPGRFPRGPWLAVFLTLPACGTPKSDASTNAGAASPADGSDDRRGVESVRETPSPSNAGSAASGEAAPGEAPRAAAESPEGGTGTRLVGVEEPSGGAGGPGGEASGSEEAGNDADETAEGGAEGETVAEPPACNIVHPGGVRNHSLTSGGREREYRLFVPDSYDGQTPLPLVLNLHGTGGNAAGQAQDSGMESLASEEGFVVVGLQGLESRWNVLLNDPGQPDDVQYASDVLDDAIERVCVDERKVYATGFSGGARMSSRLACNLGERIAAIAPVSGIRWTAPCSGRAVPVVTFHGLADPQNTYAGMAREEWVESVEDALAGWATHNGCGEVRDETPEVNGVSVYSYGGCEADADVLLYRIAGLGHTWAKNEIDATRVMWEFFRERAMP